MNSEVRSLEISNENIMAAIELYLSTMRLLQANETVVAYDLLSSGKSVINIKKEVLS